MQMCVVEITSRPGKPLFHLEHYIEGQYIKYNSNSGFVRDDNIRLTPQVQYIVSAQNVAASELQKMTSYQVKTSSNPVSYVFFNYKKPNIR